MAFDSSTALLEARQNMVAAAQGRMASNELRMPIYGALDAHLDGRGLLSPNLDIQNLRKYTGQAVRIPVLKRGIDGAVTNARACADTGSAAGGFKNLNFITAHKGFQVSYLASVTNQFDYNKQVQAGLAECLRQLYTYLDQQAIAHYETIKSTVNGGTRYKTTVAGAKRIPNADYDRLPGRLTTEMMGNDFAGLMDIVASPNFTDAWKYVQNQGAQNGQNLAYQTGDYRLYADRFIADGTGVDSTAYVHAPGTVAVFPWINQLHQQGQDIGTDVWTTFLDPYKNITWELKMKRQCLDNSANVAGGEADFVESWGLTGEFAYTEAYSSTADSGVYKYEVTVA
jgi:hypothetical protein